MCKVDVLHQLHGMGLECSAGWMQVLTCYAQMAGGVTEGIDAALNKLLEMAGQGTESVPLLLALASGFMLKQQTPKAR